MRRGLLTVTALVAALVLGSGVAFAATIVGTNQADTRNGTANRDVMSGLGGAGGRLRRQNLRWGPGQRHRL